MNQTPRGEGSRYTSQIISIFFRSEDSRIYLNVPDVEERIADGLFPFSVTVDGIHEHDHYKAAVQAPQKEWAIPLSDFPTPTDIIRPYFPHLFRPWVA